MLAPKRLKHEVELASLDPPIIAAFPPRYWSQGAPARRRRISAHRQFRLCLNKLVHTASSKKIFCIGNAGRNGRIKYTEGECGEKLSAATLCTETSRHREPP